MREVLSYYLGNCHLSIAPADGSMAKMFKSQLQHLLMVNVESAECQEISKCGCLILDAMAIIQAKKNTAENIDDYAKILFDQLITIYNDHQRSAKQWKKVLNSGENKEPLISYSGSLHRSYPMP